ncbi:MULTISPECIES: hypothetical protein [unclassified Marinimicrobium]|jgi:hypothetical protein|uniref:hypothetical protein n=1 Tax=Marinimicrobium TaxID=359337 RepID=UPI00257A9C1C|nr:MULTISPECIES: hypothetical protein [unclassified Marinimicrobium]|tara:strand:- start:206 stop:472 length:267 start_codon:yes stop_codon:yes gene_type:complete
MNRLHLSIFALTLSSASSLVVAQVDIYQSDAYSVEEMCAREAQQSVETDYSQAYEQCIDKNQDNELYQSRDGNPSAEQETTSEHHQET